MNKLRLHPFVLIGLVIVLPITLWAVSNVQKLELFAALSQTKLGVFVLWGTPEALGVTQAGPRLIVSFDPQQDQWRITLARNYKSKYPTGIAVLRVYEGSQNIRYTLTDDPAAAADDYFNRVIQPALTQLGSDAALFDYIEGSNEFENIPGLLQTAAEGDWVGKFWINLSQRIKSAGFKPVMGEISVGNLATVALNALVPYLREIKGMGGAWSYHAFGYNYSTDVASHADTALRYRQFYDYFLLNAPDLYDMLLILTEAGVAESADPYRGYRTSGSTDLYQQWLKWFDSELQKDSYVVGAALFQMGDSAQWDAFNMDPIADWFKAYLKGSLTLTQSPFAPTTTDQKVDDQSLDGSSNSVFEQAIGLARLGFLNIVSFLNQILSKSLPRL